MQKASPCLQDSDARAKLLIMSREIIFEVSEDEIEDCYTASALGFGIHTQGETMEEVRSKVKEAVACYFEDEAESPSVIRLRFVRDEVLGKLDL
jgi:predicted RNase H-like HicB family nuclease